MKKIYFMLAMAGLLSLTSCQGLFGEHDNEFYELVQKDHSDETTAAFDNSYFGLYKGIVIGPKSSGTVKMEINHGNDEAKVFITIGNKTDVLTYTKAYISENNQISQEYTTPTPLPSITNPRIYADITFKGAFSSTIIIISSYERTPDDYDKRSREISCYIRTINVEGHDNLTAYLIKETSDNVVSVFEGSCDDKKGNQGKLMLAFSQYKSCSFLRGESEGMYIDLYPSFYFEDRLSAEGFNDVYVYDENNNIDYDKTITYKYKIKYKVSADYWGGTWSTTWTGGSNSGTFTCKLPLEKEK